MRRLNLLVASGLAAALGACAPNPIIARDPIPAPGPDAAYACESRSTILNAFHSTCTPVLREPQPVLRAKG